MDISEAEELPVNTRVVFIGRVDGKPYTGVSKKKSKYLRIQVGDETGSMKVMIFNDKMEDCNNYVYSVWEDDFEHQKRICRWEDSHPDYKVTLYLKRVISRSRRTYNFWVI